MNVNSLISMVVRQLMNIGMRKAMQMATKGGAKTGKPAPQDDSIKQSAKVARRIIR